MESPDQRHEVSREPRPIRGLRTPLFDRLTVSGPESPTHGDPARVLDVAALSESVRAETARLLNTRAHLRGECAELAAGTVLDYGLPDFSSFSASSGPDLENLANAIAERLAAAEPRLEGVQVVLQPDAADVKAVTGFVSARLRTGMQMEPVTFPVQIGSAEGVKVRAAIERS
jgi:type VI secretion system protein ImpF